MMIRKIDCFIIGQEQEILYMSEILVIENLIENEVYFLVIGVNMFEIGLMVKLVVNEENMRMVIG